MFITLEGIEGSGKTTQIGYLTAYLEAKGHCCKITREPGGTSIGEQIRSVLLNGKNKDMDPVAELLLYMADRAQHVHTVVKPALDAGKTIICDRYFDATMVYQGYARGLDKPLISQLHELVFSGLTPDVTLLLDLPPEIGLKRAWTAIRSGGRVSNETRFEEEKITFHQKVREGYLDLAKKEPSRFRIIDATQNERDVKDAIIKAIAV